MNTQEILNKIRADQSFANPNYITQKQFQNYIEEELNIQIVPKNSISYDEFQELWAKYMKNE